MAVIQPFRALRYAAAAGPLAELVAPPYDVISPEERARLAALRPCNAVHLILPVGERPYEAATRLLHQWQEQRLLVRDPEPAMFVYSQRFEVEGKSLERWGLFCRLQLEPFSAGIVMPHERTLAAPKADRLRLVRACKTNLSAIFGLVDAPLRLAQRTAGADPLARFGDAAGVEHSLWRLDDAAAHQGLATAIAEQQVFIADGHHRYETSLAYRDECRASDAGGPSGNRGYDHVLTFLCSTRDPGLAVLPTHRLLAESPPAAELLDRCRSLCRIEEVESPKRLAELLERGVTRPRLGIVRKGSDRSWLLAAESAEGAGPLAKIPAELRQLDVSLLHEALLPGVPADRFAYTHDAVEAISLVAEGRYELAVLLPPPAVEDVLSVSRAGLTMPQKSTYFFPKVLTGLVYNPLT